MTNDSFEQCRQYLRDAPLNFRDRHPDKYAAALGLLKKEAVRSQKQDDAKMYWCFEQILIVQNAFIKAFFQLKDKQYYDAWCTLEKVEIGLHSLLRHHVDADEEYHLFYIEKHTSQFQSLYPYRVFMSPALLVHEKLCSICQQPISIRNPCGHRVGEIYDGEMCGRMISKADILEISMVENPVQKYSVPFLKDPKTNETIDQYNYALVRYLVERLESPFHEWRVEWTKIRHPHSRFLDVGRNQPCPCESGKKYKDCCLRESGVMRPHCLFSFSVAPPEHLNFVEYPT